ncbi:MAG TPA: sialidase family protein [Gaiellaceae bacterium]|nr:sialidase family protein [Gaiellaceae bacterium]
MKRSIAVAAVTVVSLACASAASAAWSLVGTNVVASTPVEGGGYPVPPGSTKPLPGTCGPQHLNSNHSESWLAVKPGTEDIVGSSKFFIGPWSTFYDFHLGSYTILGGSPVSNNQVQGYECTTVGTQDMPPSWTNNTDPNVDWDTEGRVYQTTLPFNAFWEGGLHPNGEIDMSYSDDMGAHWVKGNGGKALDSTNNQTSLSFGHVEDKQWIAVNHFPLSIYRDHVYAMWTTFNGANGNGKIHVAISRDRGQTFSKEVQLTTPSATTPGNTYVYPSVGPDGTVYVAFIGGFDLNKNKVGHVYVTKSVDDGNTWGPFVVAASPIENPLGYFPPTNFRDGILENFAASPVYPGHVYLTYENWDPVANHSDVYFTQSTDGGLTWSDPALVNDDGDSATDQFQPSVAAGPGGAVAVAFYDRRAACPTGDPSIITDHWGDANTCIDVSLQAYKDHGTASGAAPVGGNVRVSEFSWDPDQPAQKVGGISQYPCAGHRDPCPTGRGFIGDYFGLAISAGNIYTLAVSTHYPGPGVTADSGGPVYYQQQVLGKVPRSTFGAGY